MPSATGPGAARLHIRMLLVGAVLEVAGLVVLMAVGSLSVAQAMVLIGVAMLAFGNGMGLGHALERSRTNA